MSVSFSCAAARATPGARFIGAGAIELDDPHLRLVETIHPATDIAA